MPSRKSGAALVDEISIDQKSCFVRQNKCDFSTIADIENCFFHLNEGVLTIDHHHRLYEKSPFDPELLAPVLKPGYTITLKSENQWNAIYESDEFFIGKPFYDEYCVLFRYRQRVSGEIKVNLLIDGYEKALFHKFERPNPHKIYPWVDVAIDVKLDDEKYPLGAMAKIQYKGLYETYLARIELQNGACPATNCNGKLSCVSDRTQCVEPYQLCDTDNDCDDWSDEMGCASGCGDQSEHFETKSSLGAKPGRSSCLWRIHGRQGKKIAVKVMMFGDLDQIKFMTMFEGLKTLDSYYGGVSVDLEEGTNGTVVKEYLLNSNEATIIVDFNLVLITADGQINAMPLISYEQVDDSYCSFVCKNSECLHDNYQCDGNPGCLAEDDELDCVRENQVDGLNIAEVRQIDGSWAQVCADENFTRHIANRLCYQMGFWAASSFNYGNIVSPYYNDFVVALPDEQETKGDSWVQGMLVKGTCPSRRVWSVDCGSYACGKRQVNTRPVTRIVGGSKTYLGKWPWMVSFQIRNVHNCGGAIISDSLILTAGHCFDKNLPKVHTILVGGNNHKSPEIVRRGIKQAHIHPEYYPDSNVPNHDIAIVQLDRKVSFSKYLQEKFLPNYFTA